MEETNAKRRQFHGRTFLFWAFTLLLYELTLHLTVYGGLRFRALASVLFILSASVVLTILSSLARSEIANHIVRYLLLGLLFLLYGVQVVYYRVFDSLLALSFVSQGGNAVENFLPTVLRGVAASWFQLLVFVVPFPLLALGHYREILPDARLSVRGLAVGIAAAVALHILALVPVWLSGKNGALGGTYRDPYATVNRQCEYFGLLTAERLEIGRLFKKGSGINENAIDLGNTDAEEQPEEQSEAVALPDRNIMTELDFTGLDLLTKKKSIQQLNDFFAGRSGTLRHEYTGMFETYNLIEICAESFTPYFVDPELTPTLYKLTHEGFVFDNFYCSFPSMTTNGEYSMCMGLMPDLSRVSFATSMNNYVPFCIGNRFKAIGLSPLAYHNNIATFYNRVNTHPNMGYEFKAVDFGLDMKKGSPASDLEMMQKTVDDYIYQDQFIVHYMTYSGHADYNFEDNDMAIKNQDRVRHLDCSEELKAYYACQLELEDALTYLLDRLETAGLADRTVIVMTGDHYPYSLTSEAFEELAGEAVENDPFWRYKNAFVLWNGGMEEPVHVSEYCCTQDILPTVLNLFGMPYESRLLTGMDVLAEGTHVAVLQDGSFLTEALNYDASQAKVNWKLPEEDFPEGYADELVRTVRNEFSVSASILRNDYYRFVFVSLGLADPEDETEHHYSYEDLAGTWYANDVEILTGCGVLTGAKGSFNGDDPATRADFVVMLSRALGLKPNAIAEPPFQDAPSNAWYYDALAAAWVAGIVEGDDTFRAKDPLTQKEALQMLAAAAAYVDIPNPEQWADSLLEDALSRAAYSDIDQTTPTRGLTAALIAPLTIAAGEEP